MLGASLPDCVKVAVQVMLSGVLSPERVPPLTVMSDASKLATASLKLKVTEVDSPADSRVSTAVMVSVGAAVSAVRASEAPLPELPAKSVYQPEPTENIAE